MKYTALKGTKDVLPAESHLWHALEYHMRFLTSLYGFREIRTPVIEHTELFLRGVGDTTDIVQKETYTFDDRGGRSITLKPEGTGGAVRAFVEAGLFNDPQPTKMYYLNCPVFRYEKPQAGRLREHHQFGVDVFGSASPYTDAEVISLALALFQTLGLEGLIVHINSIGCPNCRPAYQQKLKEYFAPHIKQMCRDCQDRFERNPLRLLDCKEEACKAIAKDAPRMIDCLCDDCKAHFESLQSALKTLHIPFEIDPGIVRGLDYYTKTVFEVISNKIGAQGTICGGGRYDGLVETLGGPKTPGIGFGIGMERLLLVMQAQGAEPPVPSRCDVFVNTFGDTERALEICTLLRARGVKADFDPNKRSMKSAMRYAEKLGPACILFEGEDERAKGEVLIRAMADGEQKAYPFGEALDRLQKILAQFTWA